MPRPSVHSYASSGVISHEEVGLESGMMIGRSHVVAIERIVSSEMVPRLPERPRISPGPTYRTSRRMLTANADGQRSSEQSEESGGMAAPPSYREGELGRSGR